ncbi:MAG: CBS domain-containing protein [Huintestinicola sp.]
MNTAMLLKPKTMVSYIYADLTAADGLKEFISGGYTAVPVIDREGIYMGVVSERDFLYRMLDTKSVELDCGEGLTVGDLINNQRFDSVAIDADMDEVFSKIIDQNFVPVVDSRGSFSGIVTRKDVLMYLHGKIGAINKLST